MKSQQVNLTDDMNYQTLITKLNKGSLQQKYTSIKKLLFLYENARSRVYLYQRRIVQCLQLSLLIEENEISLNALILLQKILMNASTQSEIANTFRKKLLSKVILNLGSADINIRKISHKCIHQYIKKFKDYQNVISNYLKTALRPNQQHNTKHLKLKSINSLHSLLMSNESKYFQHSTQYSLNLIEELIYLSFQKQFIQIRRAALICLICVLKISGSQITLQQISAKTQNQLYQLSLQNQQLNALISAIMKYTKNQKIQQYNSQSQQKSQNAPSPKFISIQQSQVLIKPSSSSQIQLTHQMPQVQNYMMDNIPQSQLKIFNQVSYAQQFLKRLQKSSCYKLEQIKNFAPYLQKYLVDESIKLFSISKKIVQVIFDSTNNTNNQHKQYYVVIVPCVVKGIGNPRFIVRKNLDKLVRSYAKNYTDVWINNFLERFSKTNNPKLKEILIDLFMYSYKTSPEFYYPVEKPFEIFDLEIMNKNSNLKWKVIDCVILMIQRQSKDKQQDLQEMLQIFSLQSYNKILRKLNKNTISTIQNLNNLSITEKQTNPKSKQKQKTPSSLISEPNNISGIQLQVPSPVSVYKRKFRRNRLVTDQPQRNLSVQKDEDTTDRNNTSQDKMINLNKGLFFKQKRNRKSIVQYDLKIRRKTQKRQNNNNNSKQRTSLQKLPQLKVKNQHPSLSTNNNANNSRQHTTNHHSLSKNQAVIINVQSPVKKSFTQKNINYTSKQQLQKLQDPKSQLQKALISIKANSTNWMIQFQSINKIRSIIQNHPNVITQEYISMIITQLINCMNNMRSGVMKISLICLDQLILKFKKKIAPYTEIIINTVIKKSIGTSQFIADQLKKCICICTEELSPNKLIPTLTTLIKQTKNTQVKLNILLIIQTMVKTEKMYKSNFQWIWLTLIELHQEPQFQLRAQCKNIVKLIIQTYRTGWKSDVISFKKIILQKIDKILKTLNQKGQNAWIELENQQFQKIIFSKGISAKYFTQQYQKIQQIDRLNMIKKNWKDRIRLLNDTFSLAFEYSTQFQANLNIKKYFAILMQHMDQKNPGLMINALNVLSRAIETFPTILQQFMNIILQKYLIVLDGKKNQLISTYQQKVMQKVYKKYDLNKLSVPNNIKTRVQIINQILCLLRQQQTGSTIVPGSLSLKRQQISKQSQRQKSQKVKNKQNSLLLKQILTTVQTPTSLTHISSSNVTNSNKISYTSIHTGNQTPTGSSSHIPSSHNINTLTINSQTNIIGSNMKQTSLDVKRKSSSNYNNTIYQINQITINLLIKMINKFLIEKQSNLTILFTKIKQLITFCNKKYGNAQFGAKINLNDKLLQDFTD